MQTKIIKIDAKKPEGEKIKEAAAILKKGGLVAFPTETVYGLAALYNSAEALSKIYEVKKRPKSKPLAIHISKIETIESFNCEIPHLAKILMEKFWPGPLTIILNTKDKTKTVAFRMPKNEIAKKFIEACGSPLVAPSANISGLRPPRNAEEVLESLDGKIDAVIDGGPTSLGIESTVIDATSFPYRVLREGAISKNRIQDVWHET